MGGVKSGTNKIGEAQFASGTVPKATKATPQEVSSYLDQKNQNQQLMQRLGLGMGVFAQGMAQQDKEKEKENPINSALASQNQADAYKRWIELQQLMKQNPDSLNFMPTMPFNIQNTNPELISNAWANAPKTFFSSAIGSFMNKGM
jgi:hypothetical protein